MVVAPCPNCVGLLFHGSQGSRRQQSLTLRSLGYFEEIADLHCNISFDYSWEPLNFLHEKAPSGHFMPSF
jgi:hypothetical protein